MPVRESCPLCESSGKIVIPKARDIYTRDTFEVLECQRCGTAWIRNEPDDLRPYYDSDHGKLMGSSEHRFFESLRKVLFRSEIKHIARGLQSAEVVVEIGCGTGLYLNQLAKKTSARLMGIDMTPRPKSLSAGIEFLQASLDGKSTEEFVSLAERLNGRKTFFILRHVLEHIPSPAGLLAPLLKRFNLAGIWIVVPNWESPLRTWAGESWSLLDPPRHLTHFRPSALAEHISRVAPQLAVQTSYYGIDEVVTSLHRYTAASSHRGLNRLAPLFHAKSPLSALSSAATIRFSKAAFGLLAVPVR